MKKAILVFILAIGLLNPAAANAGTLCNDGTYSKSNGRGACSHHGGVAISKIQLNAAEALLERQKYIDLLDSAKMLELYEGRYTEIDLGKVNKSGWKEFQVCVRPKFPQSYNFCWTVSEFDLPSKKNLKDIYEGAKLADQCINKNSTLKQRKKICPLVSVGK